MLNLWIFVFLLFSFSFANDCKSNISVSQVEQISTPYVGNIKSIKLSKYKNGECYFKVYGDKGYVTIDANNGELIKFTKKRY